MITVRVVMKSTGEPLKRTSVALHMDGETNAVGPVTTNRSGEAVFENASGSGKVFVAGVERFHGRLDGDIQVELWSITQSADVSCGSPGMYLGGDTQYPGMLTRSVEVDGQVILTDSEGYLVDPSDWSESFTQAQAETEGLTLKPEHWEVVRFLRQHYAEHGVQASVRQMVKYFRQAWDDDRGTSAYLHHLFPRGGPQKQGNRLAGLLRTKGEH